MDVTSYAIDNEWDAEDIARAKEELQEVFDMYKDAYDAAVLPEVDEEQESTEQPTGRKKLENYFDMMENLENIKAGSWRASIADELYTYLSEPRESVHDVLVWWHRNAKKYRGWLATICRFHLLPSTWSVSLVVVGFSYPASATV
ncbi:hypothetical protein R3P38DRAFT_2803965 [Favolaschia claudopus]|uniref:HAT C-terminal dimerisation domain-containing protein n=1 Tax=Favolaschia claudopus TaxID=2862362 RepID=A0AAV9ZRD1_9AGAR